MAEEILEKFKKFSSRSKSAFAGLYDRIKNDRSFISGEKQWTKDDDGTIPATRNRITVNVLSNQCHSVANQYSAFPFTWYTGDPNIDREIDQFFSSDSNRFATEEALLDCVSFGLGVLALGSDIDVKGNDVPVIYAVTDMERVLLDPDSVELDGGDAMEGALIDYRSRDWIRVHMGEQYVPNEDSKMIVSTASCAEKVPIITYYYLESDGCHWATFVNDRQVDDGEEGEESQNVIPIHRIPIFPVWGERTWDGDDKETYCGLVSKAKNVQRIVNYSMTQLMERLSLSPKPQWVGYMESFKGYGDYYRKAGTGNNPIVPAKRLASDGVTVLDLPKRFDANIQFQDLQGIMDGTLNMLSSITGVDSKGLANVENDVTATAVLYTSKVFQNNVKHFFSHLRTSFKSLGDTVMVLMGHPDRTVDVAQGPDAYMEMQTARQELSALMGVVEPNQKRAIVNAILRTHPDNEILAQLYVELNSMKEPTQMEMQMQQVTMQMKQALDQKAQEIASLSAQLEEARKQIENEDKDKVFELKKLELEHQYDIENKLLDAQLKSGEDADKAAIEAERERIKLEADAQRAAMQAKSDQMKLDAQFAKTKMDLDAKEMSNQMNMINKMFGGNA